MTVKTKSAKRCGNCTHCQSFETGFSKKYDEYMDELLSCQLHEMKIEDEREICEHFEWSDDATREEGDEE